MSWLSRVVNVLRTGAVDRDLDEELRYHLESRMEEPVQSGMTRPEAEREALRRLGNPLLLRERSRDVKVVAHLESIVQDVHVGLRMLRKDVVVTAAAILSLSLAIGACTAAFSLIEALILRPLPVLDPERLVYLTYPGAEPPSVTESFNYPLFERLREAGRAQVDLFGVSYQRPRPAVFDGAGGREEKVRAQWVSGDTFAILGIKPALGRLLAAGDDQHAGQHPVAVLSHGFWTRRFGRDPAVLGRWVRLGEKEFQIVGVGQEGFSGVEPGVLTDICVPNMMWDEKGLANPGHQWFRIWGRLRPGVQPEQARQALRGTFADFRRERARGFRPDEPGDRVRRFLETALDIRSAAYGPSALRRNFERPLWILAAVVGLVLLIACSNVANLLIARAAAREREMALRVSIGAGRLRLIQQVMVESGLLATAACALGLAFASVAGPGIVSRLSPADDPAYLDLHLDWRVLAFVALVCAATTVLFGLVRALRASAVSPSQALKAGSGRQSATIGMLRPLVAAQVGFSFVVLFVAGLLLLTFQRLVRVDLGFAPAGLVLLTVEAKDLKERGEKARHAGLQLLEHVRQLPGVQCASLSAWGLFAVSGWTGNVRVAGREPDAFESYFLEVSPGFFDAMRIRLLDGREFVPRDGEPDIPYAVVQRTREIGIRVALGARRWGVVRLVARDVTRSGALGLAAGDGGGRLPGSVRGGAPVRGRAVRGGEPGRTRSVSRARVRPGRSTAGAARDAGRFHRGAALRIDRGCAAARAPE